MRQETPDLPQNGRTVALVSQDDGPRSTDGASRGCFAPHTPDSGPYTNIETGRTVSNGVRMGPDPVRGGGTS